MLPPPCRLGRGHRQWAAALLLARHSERVHASDASALQMGEAPTDFRVTYAVAPAERCSLADSSCELILAAVDYGWWYVDDEIDAMLSGLIRRLEPHWLLGNWMLIDGYRGIDFPGEEVRVPPPQSTWPGIAHSLKPMCSAGPSCNGLGPR